MNINDKTVRASLERLRAIRRAAVKTAPPLRVTDTPYEPEPLTWDDREAFRRRILDAFDEAVTELMPPFKFGWRDEDLPALFAAIDNQIDKIERRRRDALED